MKPFSLNQPPPVVRRVIEKIEILRSTLRWATELERPQIENLLRQCNDVRDG